MANDTDNPIEGIAAPIALSPGVKVREFIIERKIGEGSFGIVYIATHEILGETVAIKEFLPRDLARRTTGNRVEALPGSEETYAWARERFLREARTLKALADPTPHPNLVQVIHAFPENDTVYMCMRYEEGAPLEEILSEHGTANENELRRILFPLLDGLEHAHACGVWHRDIKPSNILIRDDGSPVLIDFGAARQDVGRTDRSTMAQCTPGYAAPEQLWSGEEQGPWTDIFAMGATLYRALTGKPPPGFSRVCLSQDYKGRYSDAFLAAIDAALEPKVTDRPQSVMKWRSCFDSDTTGTTSADAPTKLRQVAGPWEPTKVIEPQASRVLSSSSAPTSEAAVEQPQSSRKSRVWVWTSLVIVVLAVGAGGLWEWLSPTENAQKTAEPQTKIEENASSVTHEQETPGHKQQPPLDLEPGIRSATLATVQHMLAGLRCARLETSLSPDGVLTLNGYLDSKEDLNDLRARLLALKQVKQLQVEDVQIYVWPFCQVLADLADATTGADARARTPSILFNKPQASYREGEYLVVTAMNNTPDEGYLYLDYVDNTGSVVHMLPTLAELDNRVSGWGEVVLGADDEVSCRQKQCYRISPPHGGSLMVAVWSREPLFSKPRPSIEEQALDYFASISTLIRNAKNRSRDVAGVSYRFLQTRE